MEQKIVALTYKPGPRTLQIFRGDVVFWVDGVQRTFRSLAAGEIIAIIASRHPKTIDSKTLFRELNHVVHVGSNDTLDSTIHKYVSEARKSIEEAGMKVNIIKNVRRKGYRLADGWEVNLLAKPASLVDTELDEIKKLIERCIEHVRVGRIVTNNGGLMYIEMDQRLTQENFLLLDRFGWKLIHVLSRPGTVPDVIDIKRDIEKLMTYVLFWRVGDGLAEEKWKSDYETEIQKIFGDIEMRVNKIMKMQ